MAWKIINGYRYTYRVSDQGEVQKQRDNGSWKTLKPYPYNDQWRVSLRLPNGEIKKVQVIKLVTDAFLGGTPKGMLRVHKNGMKQDNAVENIMFATHAKVSKMYRPGNCRTVLKVDRDGEVVDIYRSISDAARKNHISQGAINKRCQGQVRDPYRLDGYNYIYEDRKRGRP